MKRVEHRTHEELPAATLLVCETCTGLAGCPNDTCPEPHGTAHPLDLLRRVCLIAGHVLVVNGKAYNHCTRCRQPRFMVTS